MKPLARVPIEVPIQVASAFGTFGNCLFRGGQSVVNGWRVGAVEVGPVRVRIRLWLCLSVYRWNVVRRCRGRQVVRTEVKVKITALGQLHCSVNGSSIVWEEGPHLLFRLHIRLVRHGHHTRHIIHRLAGADRVEDLVNRRVFSVQVVRAVGDDGGQAKLCRNGPSGLIGRILTF